MRIWSAPSSGAISRSCRRDSARQAATGFGSSANVARVDEILELAQAHLRILRIGRGRKQRQHPGLLQQHVERPAAARLRSVACLRGSTPDKPRVLVSEWMRIVASMYGRRHAGRPSRW